MKVSDLVENSGHFFGGLLAGYTSRRSLAHLGNLFSLIDGFQEDFLEYSLVGADIHKRMRLALDEIDHRGDDPQHSRLMSVFEIGQDLVRHFGGGFERAAKLSAKYLEQYFEIDERTKWRAPRICIKELRGEQICDVWRHNGKRENAPFHYKENSGFQYVVENGCPYHCPDIPKAVVNGDYRNTRIDRDKAAKSKSLLGRRWLNLSRDPTDNAWEVCWQPYDPGHVDPFSCYKSTMIFPMRLDHASMSRRLVEILGLDIRDQVTKFGFLCLDHRHTKFFNETSDIQVGSIFANLLSLYRVMEWNYFRSSETINRARDRFRTHGTDFQQSYLFDEFEARDVRLPSPEN